MSERLSQAQLQELWEQGADFRILGIFTLGKMAPCQSDGEVRTFDDDTKDAVCICRANPNGCRVNGRNMILGALEQATDEELSVARVLFR